MIARHIIMMLAVLFLLGCDQVMNTLGMTPSEEVDERQVQRMVYVVENHLTEDVTVSGTGLFRAAVPWQATRVPAGGSAIVIDIETSTTGHLRPSNYFRTFEVRSAASGTVVYTGVTNSDWVTHNHTTFTLPIR